MMSTQEFRRLKKLDAELMKSFVHRYPGSRSARSWRNSQVKDICARGVSAQEELAALERLFTRKGAFNIRIERRPWVDLDGERKTHTLARAAVTDMWPMGTHYWLRDNAIIAARYLASPRAPERRVGKELLLSGLTFISSISQLRRFEEMVRSEKRNYQADPAHWPYIFADITRNLNCAQEEGWAHKQDAWQILAWHLLDALESGMILARELNKKHRRFLGLIIPFLAKVKFYECENSGSWEEIPAIRTSVRAWEHRLIARLCELAHHKQFSFLTRDFERFKPFLGAQMKRKTLQQAVAILDATACKKMLRDLPWESPAHPPQDARQRRADAALIYLLELGYVRFLGERTGKSRSWIESMERRVLSVVLGLQDKRTGGIARYRNDSYQREGFFRNLTVARLKELYGAPSGDASSHFTGRARIVPKGRTAAWTHFVWQLASWSGVKFLESGDRSFLRQHTRFFRQGLRLLTGSGEGSLDVDSRGRVRAIRVAPFRMPECFISDRDAKGRPVVFASPHTPLNWATAEMLHAFTVRRRVLSARK